MDNWGIKPKLTVVYGARDVTFNDIGLATRTIVGEQGILVSPISIQRDNIDYTVFNKGKLEEDHMLEVTACLHDHIANTNIEDWTEYIGDKGDISIHKGRYYGPNCVADVYYITNA